MYHMNPYKNEREYIVKPPVYRTECEVSWHVHYSSKFLFNGDVRFTVHIDDKGEIKWVTVKENPLYDRDEKDICADDLVGGVLWVLGESDPKHPYCRGGTLILPYRHTSGVRTLYLSAEDRDELMRWDVVAVNTRKYARLFADSPPTEDVGSYLDLMEF